MNYDKLAFELQKRRIPLDSGFLPLSVFENGGKGYTPSLMKSLVLKHPNYASARMIYLVNGKYVIFTRSKRDINELIEAFNFMLNKFEPKYPIEIVRM